MENSNVQSMELEAPAINRSNARGPEIQSIQKVIDYYIEGIRNGDVASLQKCFHPQSSIFGYKGADLYMAPMQALYDYVTAMPVPAQTGEPTTFYITSIRVTGKMATVEVAADSYHGHNYLDHFQLIKVEDRWWIVSKIFYAEPQSH